MTGTAADVLAGLADARTEFKNLEAPASPGVYAFFLIGGISLPRIAQPGTGPLYVGTSGNLAQREFDTHLRAGQSGFSTLRRSLGALLLDVLDLRPQARGTGASPTNFRNYRFDDAGEVRLSNWMDENLRLGVHPFGDPDDLEKELIGLACPPLNLKGWANPDATAVKEARKACVELARTADPRR